MRVVGKIRFPGHAEIPREVERILGKLSVEERETLRRYLEAVHWSGRYPLPINPAHFMRHKDKRRIKESPDKSHPLRYSSETEREGLLELVPCQAVSRSTLFVSR